MCDHLNEYTIHPLAVRVKVLERYLDEAISIIAAKARPSDGCLMNAWIEEAIAVLEDEPIDD